MAKKSHKEIADQFSDPEMEGVKRYGEALGGVTPFDEEVERHLAGHEANYAKMRAAQTGGGGLGASKMETAASQQTGAIQQQAATAGQAQAAQAQAAQVPNAPPPAPSGAAGVSQPYPAEEEETPPGVPEAPGGAK